MCIRVTKALGDGDSLRGPFMVLFVDRLTAPSVLSFHDWSVCHLPGTVGLCNGFFRQALPVNRSTVLCRLRVIGHRVPNDCFRNSGHFEALSRSILSPDADLKAGLASTPYSGLRFFFLPQALKYNQITAGGADVPVVRL